MCWIASSFPPWFYYYYYFIAENSEGKRFRAGLWIDYKSGSFPVWSWHQGPKLLLNSLSEEKAKYYLQALICRNDSPIFDFLFSEDRKKPKLMRFFKIFLLLLLSSSIGVTHSCPLWHIVQVCATFSPGPRRLAVPLWKKRPPMHTRFFLRGGWLPWTYGKQPPARTHADTAWGKVGVGNMGGDDLPPLGAANPLWERQGGKGSGKEPRCTRSVYTGIIFIFLNTLRGSSYDLISHMKTLSQRG